MRTPEDAPFLRAAFSARRRSSSAFSSSSDMRLPSCLAQSLLDCHWRRSISSMDFCQTARELSPPLQSCPAVLAQSGPLPQLRKPITLGLLGDHGPILPTGAEPRTSIE